VASLAFGTIGLELETFITRTHYSSVYEGAKTPTLLVNAHFVKELLKTPGITWHCAATALSYINGD
jgi:hypothetical protein